MSFEVGNGRINHSPAQAPVYPLPPHAASLREGPGALDKVPRWADRDGTENGGGSFHWTNCAPQHYRFNQGAKLWLGLEDWVIDSFAGDGGRRACVINGPVFDAPLSAVDNGGLVPNLKGKAHKDPVFGDSEVAIPKLYFEVVACRDAEYNLAAAGFVMSQEALLGGLDRIQGMPPVSEEKLTNAEARLYQVSIEDLSRLVDLDFGPLTSHEVSIEEVAADGLLRPIARFEDIRL